MVGDRGFVHRRRSLGRHSYHIPIRHSYTTFPRHSYIYIYGVHSYIYIYIYTAFLYGIPIRDSYTTFLASCLNNDFFCEGLALTCRQVFL